ncbi:MAG: ABC transporter ATP-binding protein [Acidimicrobiia bacterium]
MKTDGDRELRRAGWRLMYRETRLQWHWVLSGVLTGIGWTGFRIAVPLLAAAAIDNGILKGNPSVAVRYALLILVAGALQVACGAWRRFGAFRVAYKVETDLRDRLFAHLQQLNFAFHDRAQTGQLMARANTDLSQVQGVVILVPLTIASMLTLLAVIVIMVSTNVILAVLALGTLPLLNVAATRFSKRIQPLGLELQQKLADLSGVVEESVSGVRVVKGFGAERVQVRRVQEESDAVFDQSVAMVKARAAFLPLIDLFPTLALVAILWYGGHLVLDKQLQIGTLVAFNSFILMLIWPLRMLGMVLAMASRASAAAGRIDEILRTDPDIHDHPNADPLPSGPGAMHFENVVFGYRAARPVLEGFSLEIDGGEAVALVGATGSGKSTVARLVPRFYDVDRGRITVDGADIRDVRLHELRRAVGMVFEDTFLFSDTVRNNIAFADPEATAADVERAARLAGAHEFISRLPDGYDTMIGEHGYSLSGGQRQRIAIARSVVADPRVLILDDATSAVDPTKEHEIRSALNEVMRGRTTIIIAHRPATIALADRVVLVDDGVVAAQGTHAQLLATSERYREVLARAAESDALGGAEVAS